MLLPFVVVLVILLLQLLLLLLFGCCICCCSYWPLLSHINALCWQLGLVDGAAAMLLLLLQLQPWPSTELLASKNSQMLKNTAIRQQQKKPGQSLSRVDAHRNVFKVRSMLPFLMLLLLALLLLLLLLLLGALQPVVDDLPMMLQLRLLHGRCSREIRLGSPIGLFSVSRKCLTIIAS